MPSWGEVLAELKTSAVHNNGVPNFDKVRRRYLNELQAKSKRSTIIYYSDWLSGNSAPVTTMMTLDDMTGFMETVRGVDREKLDLILHVPGGQPEAAASIVSYLRQKFDEIRVIVPLAAMSAGTMLALSADEIVMGSHSQLGPIDPQMQTAQGYVPARAILNQFDRAKKEIAADPSTLTAWIPILQQYGTGLLTQCEAAETLSIDLVSQWLSDYMFSDSPDKAVEVAKWFGDFESHSSHSLGLRREEIREQGVVVTNLEDDPKLQDAVLTVHHAAMHTLGGACYKLIENHQGKGLFRTVQLQQIAIPAKP